MKKIGLLLTIGVLAIIFFSCDKNEENDNNDDPVIVDCNSVKYMGYTYTNLGCAPGIASFNTTVTQNDHTASFSITCSGGCISSVSVN